MTTTPTAARVLLAAALISACDGSSPASSSEPAPAQRDAATAPPTLDAAASDAGADADTAVLAPPDASTAPPDAAAADAGDAGDGGAQEPLEFESVQVLRSEPDVIVEKVTYRSEGLLIVGQVCRPNPTGASKPGPYPVAIANHGGFSGIGAWNGGNCVDNAKKGWVVAESSYRGEDGSQGAVEVCLGEVTDVLRLTAIVLAQPYADATHAYMSGVSHGGCITTRAVQRGAPVQLAIDIFGPTDWAEVYADWVAGIAANSPNAPSFRLLKAALDTAVGGGPDKFADAYALRSPARFGSELARSPIPYMRIQGGADALVPTTQGCALAAVTPGSLNYHVATSGAVIAAAPAECTALGLTWQAGPRPSNSWPAQRYFMFYDDVGHGFEGAGAGPLFTDMIGYLLARFPE